jgi:small subunit ribosomal protein S19
MYLNLNKNILKLLVNLKLKNVDSFKIKDKNIVILKEFVGIVFYVYNGLNYKKIMILPNMVGHKLGEFVFTRKKFKFKKKKK